MVQKLPALHKPRQSGKLLLVLGVLLMVALATALVIWWSTKGREASQTWEIGQPVAAITLNSDGGLVVLGLEDGSIQIRQVEDGTIRGMISAHRTRVNAIAFSPDGRLLASGDPATVLLWQVQVDKTPVISATSHLASAGETLAFDPAGQLLASGGSDGVISLWSATDGSLHRKLQAHVPSVGRGYGKEYGVSSLKFSLDGKTLYAAHYDNVVQQWQTIDGRLLNTQTGFNPSSDAISPFTRRVIVNVQLDLAATIIVGSPRAYVWQLNDRSLLHVWEGNMSDIWSLAFSPDGQLAASGGGRREGDYANAPHVDDFSIYVWHLSDGKLNDKLVGHTDSVTSVAWSPDGKLLVSGSDDGTVRLWRVK